MLTSRTITLLSTLFSTLTLISIIVFVPLFFTYVQRTNTAMLSQLYKCQIDSSDIWKEVTQLGSRSRLRRQSAQYAPQSAIEADSCCSCQQGKPGPSGMQGKPGTDGKAGYPGGNGRNGRPGQYIYSNPSQENSCQKCPPAMNGPPGLPGIKGPRGPAGSPGQPGTNGTPGRPGPPGPTGLRGAPAQPGPQGPHGDPGRILNGAPPGIPGPPGPMGPRGRAGVHGNDGGPGLEGFVGERGEQGERGNSGNPGLTGPPGPLGSQGPRGTCSHCLMGSKRDGESDEKRYEPLPPSVIPPPHQTKPGADDSTPTIDVPRIYSNSPVQGDGSKPQGYSIFTSSSENMPEYRRKQQQQGTQRTHPVKWSQIDGRPLWGQFNQPTDSSGGQETLRRQQASGTATRRHETVQRGDSGTDAKKQETIQEDTSEREARTQETVAEDSSWTEAWRHERTGTDSSEIGARKQWTVQRSGLGTEAQREEMVQVDGRLHSERTGGSSQQHKSLKESFRHQHPEIQPIIRAAKPFTLNRQPQSIDAIAENTFADPYKTQKITYRHQIESQSSSDLTRLLSPPILPQQYG